MMGRHQQSKVASWVCLIVGACVGTKSVGAKTFEAPGRGAGGREAPSAASGVGSNQRIVSQISSAGALQDRDAARRRFVEWDPVAEAIWGTVLGGHHARAGAVRTSYAQAARPPSEPSVIYGSQRQDCPLGPSRARSVWNGEEERAWIPTLRHAGLTHGQDMRTRSGSLSHAGAPRSEPPSEPAPRAFCAELAGISSDQSEVIFNEHAGKREDAPGQEPICPVSTDVAEAARAISSSRSSIVQPRQQNTAAFPGQRSGMVGLGANERVYSLGTGATSFHD